MFSMSYAKLLNLSQRQKPLSWMEERTRNRQRTICEFESSQGTPNDSLSG